MNRSFKLPWIIVVCAVALAAALAANGQQKQDQKKDQSQPEKNQPQKIYVVSPQQVAAALKRAGYRQPPQHAGNMLDVPVDSHNVIGSTPKPIRNPLAGDPHAVAVGKRLYRALNCEVCHGIAGGGGQGELLENGKWRYGGKPADIYLSISHGRPKGMPAWGAALSPRDIWYLVTYVKTLPGSKPDFPPPAPATLQNKSRQAPIIRSFGTRPASSSGGAQ